MWGSNSQKLLPALVLLVGILDENMKVNMLKAVFSFVDVLWFSFFSVLLNRGGKNN